MQWKALGNGFVIDMVMYDIQKVTDTINSEIVSEKLNVIGFLQKHSPVSSFACQD